jgi:hypothetical protein
MDIYVCQIPKCFKSIILCIDCTAEKNASDGDDDEIRPVSPVIMWCDGRVAEIKECWYCLQQLCSEHREAHGHSSNFDPGDSEYWFSDIYDS